MLRGLIRAGRREAGVAGAGPRTSIRGLPLLGVGIAVQLVLGPSSTAPFLLVLSMASIFGFVLINRTSPGLRLVLLGMALNLVVIGLNGAMPVSGSPFPEGPEALVVPEGDVRHSRAGSGTRLALLGDVVPFGGRIFSPGDILMAAGLGLFVLSSLRDVARLPTGGTKLT